MCYFLSMLLLSCWVQLEFLVIDQVPWLGSFTTFHPPSEKGSRPFLHLVGSSVNPHSFADVRDTDLGFTLIIYCKNAKDIGGKLHAVIFLIWA